MGIVTTIAPFALALIMLGLGASLTTNDFSRVVKNPKEFSYNLIKEKITNLKLNYLKKKSLLTKFGKV